jgi:hypothetical protein
VASAAVIVGIDAYATQPLTSAVNDAQAFGSALVKYGLVPKERVTLLTSPVVSGAAGEATRENILGALYPFYREPGSAERLFFGYAGHGMLTFTDAAQAVTRTALLPVDVVDLDQHGDRLIDLDMLLARFRLCGPAEQFFLIDACRDLAYDKHPDVGSAIGWASGKLGQERAQAVLYAVPPLGRAMGERGEMGVMTRHAIEALAPTGVSLHFDPDRDTYAVTPESIKEYVEKRVRALVEPLPLWQRLYSLPSLDHREPKWSPLRTIANPEPSELTVTVEPEEAALKTEVSLSLMLIEKCAWPPNRFGEPFSLDPMRYWLTAESTAGTPEPMRVQVDVREQDSIEIRIREGGEEAPAAGPSPEPGPSRAEVETAAPRQLRGVAAPSGDGFVEVTTREREATIDLERLDPPYTRWTGRSSLREKVPPGQYRVRCRIGSEIFSESELSVDPGEQVNVTPKVEESDVVSALVGPGATTAVISESIGEIQGALLATVLPIVGIKPFDDTGELFGQFSGAVPRRDARDFGDRPLSVVLAIDGNRWPVPVEEVLGRVRCRAVQLAEEHEIVLAPLGEPLERVLLGIAPALATAFDISFDSPHFGRIEVASAALDGRATVVSLAVRPDGSFDLGQNLLRLPGREYEEPVPYVSYGRLLRDLQLGQKLFAGGELADEGARPEALMDLFYAKWTDPVLSCMAFFATLDRLEAEGTEAGGLPEPWFLDEVATNLDRFFGDLPDSRVIHALRNPGEIPALLSELSARGAKPILLRSAVALAKWGVEHEHSDASIAEALRRAVPGQPWLMSWQPTTAGAGAETREAVLA